MDTSSPSSETTRAAGSTAGYLLMAIAFFGIFVYGLLTALPGTVIPNLKASKFLQDDGVVANFLLINAIGAVLAYIISGPITDKIGKKFTLSVGALLVIGSMAGFAFVVSRVEPTAATFLIFLCGFVLGLGANAIVSAGHALVGDVAVSWRDPALNLLDICFGLGLSTLPLIFNPQAALSQIFWILAAAALALVLIVILPKFPRPSHPESFPFSEAKGLFGSISFWFLAIALFMYVGSEVAVGKWVTTLLQEDSQLLASFAQHEQAADFALKTLSWFGFALMIGRLISSFLLGVVKMNSFLLLAIGSAICTIGLGIAFNSTSPETVRWGVFASGIGMGPIFPTSVGLASAIAPRIAGTAMSWVMGLGFAGLLVIPPAVGYISKAIGGEKGDVRKGLLFVLGAVVLMLLLHIGLMLRERKRATA